MKVKDIMTKEVFTLRPEHQLDLAEDMMNWQRIRHIPVVNASNELVGLITHRDLLKASVSTLANISKREQRDLYHHIYVRDVMQSEVRTVAPDLDLREAAALMIDQKIGCLPVVQDRRLVGIITEADFLTLAWEAAGRAAGASKPARKHKEART